MIVLLDTSSAVCRLALIDGASQYQVEWEANRELARGLLGFLETQLQQHQKRFLDITAIGVYQGPGSFTGLRIGIAVLNTLAESLKVPIVGETGEAWQEKALNRLKSGENQQIVLPMYGAGANITLPRK